MRPDEALEPEAATRFEIVPIAATVDHESAFVGLFEACSSTCFCRYWHFDGNKSAWLERAAAGGVDNRDEQTALLRAEHPGAGGLLAFARRPSGAAGAAGATGTASATGEAVGWMKLTPRAAVPKLRRLPVYRALDLGPDDGVFSVGCLLVRPDLRGQGVARALIAAAAPYVRERGGVAVEAYPRRCAEPMHAEEVWMGPEALFLEAGFTPVVASAGWAEPYPVLRKSAVSA